MPNSRPNALHRSFNELVKHLPVVQAIAHSPNNELSQAAKHLEIPLGKVSYAIERLEAHLGERIVDSYPSVHRRLTPLGRSLAALADEISPAVEHFLETRTAQQRAVPVLRVASIQSAWTTYSEELMRSCGAHEGQMLVQSFFPGTPDAVRAMVNDRAVDIGIVSYQPLVSSPILSKPVKSEEMVVAAPINWQARLVKGKVTDDRLRDSVVLLFDKGLKIEEVVRAHLFGLRCSSGKLRHRGKEVETIIDAVARSEGISILPGHPLNKKRVR